MLSETVLATWSPRLLGLLRIVTGFLFVQHGTGKIFHVPYVEMFAGQEFQIASLMGVAGILEVVGGSLILIGLFTRPVAFILSGQMAFAYFIAHAPQAPLPIQNNGELAVVWCFTFLYFAAAGAGAWSVDGMRGRA